MSETSNQQTPARKQIKLPNNENSLFVPADQLIKIPRREDDKWLAGDLIWMKTKGFPWWPCIITVDPETGKYSKIVVIRDKNDKAFHVQYFGSKAYRGYTQGNIMKYESKEKYELKLDQIKNTPTPNKSQRKIDLTNYEIKSTFKKDWNLACDQADAAMKLDRAVRIETLTFEYILDKPKSNKKRSIESEDYDHDNKSQVSNSDMKKTKSSTNKKHKSSGHQASATKTPSTLKSESKVKRMKKSKSSTKSSPTDVYDFDEFEDEFQDEISISSKKPFELSSAKRAKGEYEIYAKQLRADIERENPDLDEDEIEAKLRHNWDLMAEDMRNAYAPRPSLFQSDLSFQLDSPNKVAKFDDENSDAELPIPDLNNSTSSTITKGKRSSSNKKKKAATTKVKTSSTPSRNVEKSAAKRPKTGLKVKAAETNGHDFEKENAAEEMDTNETNTVQVEENGKDDDEQVVTSTNRGSSRKRVFNQGNVTNEAVNENTANNTPKRQSARSRTPKASTESTITESTITEPAPPQKVQTPKSKTKTSIKTPSSTTSDSTSKQHPPTSSTRSSSRLTRRSSATNVNISDENEESKPEDDLVEDKKSNSIENEIVDKPMSDNVLEKTVSNSDKQLSTAVPVEETNGTNEDSVSCSSESIGVVDKLQPQLKETNDESKDKLCSKCLQTDKGLIKCDGECQSHFHKECLHQTAS